MLAHPRVSRPVAHHWAFTFQSAPPRSRASLRGLIRTGHVPASRCFVFLLGTEPGDRTLQTWFVRPRTSPAVLARRGSGPWSRTTIASSKSSRPTVRRSQNESPRAESNRVARRSEHRRQIPWRGRGVSGWSRTIAEASFVARPPDPPAETWRRVRVSISLFEVENLAT
jgi:hypothetical protein